MRDLTVAKHTLSTLQQTNLDVYNELVTHCKNPKILLSKKAIRVCRKKEIFRHGSVTTLFKKAILNNHDWLVDIRQLSSSSQHRSQSSTIVNTHDLLVDIKQKPSSLQHRPQSSTTCKNICGSAVLVTFSVSLFVIAYLGEHGFFDFGSS